MSVRQRKKPDVQVDETPTTSETLLNDKIKTKPWPPVIAEAPNWAHNLSDKSETTKKFRLLHWGPLIALFIIGFISAVTTHFMMMWWPFDSLGGLCHLAVFVAWNYFTLINMFNASFIGAGYIPLGWNPPEEGQKEQLQFCKPCNGFKAPRSHHCSKCKRCCMKMDHHCPWINNCVGHRNHVHFVRFLFFAIVGCTHAIVIHIICCYHLVNQMWYMRFGTGTEPFIVVTFWSLIALVGASAFAFGVAIGLSGLLFFQMKGLWKNRTGIEDYIDQKAINRYEHEEAESAEWSYPYDLGSRRNLQDTVFNSWAGNTKGNGIWWPVMENCDQFTFTREQLAQKEAKRRMARLVKITEDFAGGIFGSCRFGCKVFVCQPISEEARVKVVPGEQWVITQCTKYWFYGYKYDEEEPTTKGWFPRRVGELQEERPYYS